MRALFWWVTVLFCALGCQLIAGDFTIDDPPSTSNDGECKAGAYRCNDEYLLTCGAGDAGWVVKQPCGSASLCDSMAKRCLACKSGDLRCDGAWRQECNADGTGWKQVEACPGASMCNPTYCGACKPGELACRGELGNAGTELWECGTDGGWSVHHDDCSSAGLCQASLEAARSGQNTTFTCIDPVCDVGEYVCDGAELKHCRPDQTGLDLVDTCASPALCNMAVSNAAMSTGTVDMCPPGCTAGAYVCEGLTLKQCRDDLTGFDAVITCGAGMECNPVSGGCTDLCTAGEYQCNGATLRFCQADRHWMDKEVCASAALCQATSTPVPSGQCIAPGCQKAGDYSCDGAALSRCPEDLTDYKPEEQCATPELCSAIDKRCNTPTCDPDEYRCFDSELRQCNAGRTDWNLIATCKAGEFCSNDPLDPGCKLECPPADRCNGAERQTCTPNGWVHQANCATNDLCNCAVAGNCPTDIVAGCGTPLCGVNAYQCVGAELQRCDTGRDEWLHQQDCASATLCYAGSAPNVSGYCLTCPTANELKCTTSGTSTTVQKCSPDRTSWTLQQTCGSFGCIDNGTNDYCAGCGPANSVTCSGATLRRCDATQRNWNDTMCASTSLCDQANAQCDVCAAGSSACAGNTLQICSNDGQKLNSTTCTGICDAAGKQCDVCSASTSRCDKENLYKCSSDGQMETKTTCATAALCNKSMQRCDTPACASTDKQCDGAQPEKCNADRTGFEPTGMPCISEPLCVDGVCQPKVCDANKVECSGTTLRQCNSTSSDWVTLATCDAPELCDAAGERCAFCATGAYHCTTAGVLQQCNTARTAWADVMACDSAALCDATAGVCHPTPICTANAYHCANKTLQKCKADGSAYDDVMTCPVICDEAGKECDDCAAPQYLCTMNALQTCDTTGHWGMPVDCGTDTCDETTGACVAP